MLNIAIIVAAALRNVDFGLAFAIADAEYDIEYMECGQNWRGDVDTVQLRADGLKVLPRQVGSQRLECDCEVRACWGCFSVFEGINAIEEEETRVFRKWLQEGV